MEATGQVKSLGRELQEEQTFHSPVTIAFPLPMTQVIPILRKHLRPPSGIVGKSAMKDD